MFYIKCNKTTKGLAINDLKDDTKSFSNKDDFNLRKPCDDCSNLNNCINKLKLEDAHLCECLCKFIEKKIINNYE